MKKVRGAKKETTDSVRGTRKICKPQLVRPAEGGPFISGKGEVSPVGQMSPTVPNRGSHKQNISPLFEKSLKLQIFISHKYLQNSHLLIFSTLLCMVWGCCLLGSMICNSRHCHSQQSYDSYAVIDDERIWGHWKVGFYIPCQFLYLLSCLAHSKDIY